MASTITIPDFNFTAFYYPEILEALIQYKRRYVPELTEELPQDPFIQLLRAYALVGHLNNTLIDLVANESYLPTAKLADSVREMLKLINYTMKPATPSQVDLVYELSKVFTTSFELISLYAQASTKRDGDNPVIFFESLEALTIDRTDQLSAVYASEDGVFTDFTTKANSVITPVDDWTPWATPVSKDSIYFGHSQIMWNKLTAYHTTPSANITGVFEFYDGDWQKIEPTSVTDIGGGQLQINLTSLLGTSNKQGTEIRVMLNSTGTYENVYSTWTGSTNIATIGLLGQTTVSTTITDYTIGSDWTILDDVTDGTSDFTIDGAIEYTLPQTVTKYWKKTTVNGTSAFWLRYRIISVNTPTSPTLINVRIDEGTQYAIRSCTQGKSYEDEPYSSTGEKNQIFEMSQENFINNSDTLIIDSEKWTRVDDFLSSKSGDKHYRVELGTNDRGYFVCGDGVNGSIPPSGVGNVIGSYRYGAQDNGNVGANTVTIDKTGLTFINKIFNPRQASGWAEAQGASEESLELAKIEGPASLRIKDVAVSIDDIATLSTTYTDENGSSPFSRAIAIEEGFGPKTVELVLVARGGGIASADQLNEIEIFMNGDKYSSPPKESHIVANQQVGAVNYTQKNIDVTATVYGDVTEDEVKSRLQKIIQPEAKKIDGITWEFEFGGEVSTSRISHEIFETDESITKVLITVPAGDSVSLQPRELPVIGTMNITVINS